MKNKKLLKPFDVVTSESTTKTIRVFAKSKKQAEDMVEDGEYFDHQVIDEDCYERMAVEVNQKTAKEIEGYSISIFAAKHGR